MIEKRVYLICRRWPELILFRGAVHEVLKNYGYIFYTYCRTKTDRNKIPVTDTFKENLTILVNLQAKLIRTGRLTLTHFNLFHFRFLFSMEITIVLFWHIFIFISWPHLIKHVFTMTGE